MLIDTHSHINFKAFKEDADAVVKRSLDRGVWQIVVGAELKTSQRAVEYASKYGEGVYAAIGLHPFHVWAQEIAGEGYKFTTRGEQFNEDQYTDLVKNPKVVAIGEIGLDYYRIDDEHRDEIIEKQKKTFIAQLQFAQAHDLPCIVHCRQAHEDVLSILRAEIGLLDRLGAFGDRRLVRVVMHCFSGNLEQAKQYVELGCLFSFNGLITFAHDWDEVIKWLPIEKIMLETDCPFMTPVPWRGQRNEPIYVKYVAEKITELKNLDFETVARETVKNSREFFKLLLN
jgi:TatD DNase family protein